VAELSADDQKLVTLARAARARIRATTGAAVRDETGRTYAGADVALASLAMTSVDLAVAQAAASGAERIDAMAIVTDAGSEQRPATAAAADLGCAQVIWANAAGEVLDVSDGQ
jgi:cytidine deaminase